MKNEPDIQTKAGYAALLGKPNAGKSTLMNAILGAKLSIVTPKPQTTRKRVLGIFTDETKQIIFFDNPGIIEPKHELHRSMMNYVSDSLAEADILVYLIDVFDYINNDIARNHDFSLLFPRNFYEHFMSLKKPKIAVLNKIDLLHNLKDSLPIIKDLSDAKIFNEIIPLSALKNFSTKELIKVLGVFIPDSQFYYDAETLSTQPQRFFVSELVREYVFLKFREEVPYSTEININEFKERENGKWYISVDIIVERPTQKAIMIGENGSKIRSLGEDARKAIEEHLQTPVFLELFVKVREKWRNNKNLLKSYGY